MIIRVYFNFYTATTVFITSAPWILPSCAESAKRKKATAEVAYSSSLSQLRASQLHQSLWDCDRDIFSHFSISSWLCDSVDRSSCRRWGTGGMGKVSSTVPPGLHCLRHTDLIMSSLACLDLAGDEAGACGLLNRWQQATASGLHRPDEPHTSGTPNQ